MKGWQLTQAVVARLVAARDVELANGKGDDTDGR